MSCQHDSRTQENFRPQKCDLCVSLNFRIMKFIKMQNCPTASHIQVGVCVFFWVGGNPKAQFDPALNGTWEPLKVKS